MKRSKNVPGYDFFNAVRSYYVEYMPCQRCLSDNTIQASKDAMNLLLDYMNGSIKIPTEKITFQLFDTATIMGFLEWLGTERGCSNSTINHRLSCIRSFFKYASWKDITLIYIWNEMKLIPKRKTPVSKNIEFMSEKALKILLEQPDTAKRNEFRDCFFMTLIYDSAARNSELLNLKVKDVVAGTSCPMIIVTGKGRKKRNIPILSKTVEMFRAYMGVYHAHNSSPEDYLFYVMRHEQKYQMSVDNVAKFMNKYGALARVKCNEVPEHIHPHMFRRTRAMHLYRSGMPLPLLSEFLGHENLETTLIYAWADTEMKRRAIEKATIANTENLKIVEKPIWKGNGDMIRRLSGLL